MNSRERVEAALGLESPDRPPQGSWGHTFDQEWSVDELAAITVERAREFGWDFVKFQPRGSRYEPRPGEYAELLESPVREKDDWASVDSLDAEAPSLADQVEAIGRVA